MRDRANQHLGQIAKQPYTKVVRLEPVGPVSPGIATPSVRPAPPRLLVQLATESPYKMPRIESGCA
jgi:hypothetical protein